MMTAGPFSGSMPVKDMNMGRPPPSSQPQENQHNSFGNGSSNFSNGIPTSQQRDNPQNSGRPVDLRIILSHDEVAFLFGFDGNLINQLRQQTGAHIRITEGESFEYVFLVSGTIDIIFKAFSLVCRKLWDLLTNIAGPGHNRPLKIRIAVPAVQCGSIIGKAGAKVKEIRDLTGAQIQVSHEPLPNSSERCVEISGSGESCLQCTYHICCVMQDAPIRGEVIPYIPPLNAPPPGPPPMMDNAWRPVFLCGDKAFIIDGQFARPAPPELLRRELAKTPLGGQVAESLASGGNGSSSTPDHMNPLTLMAAINKAQQNGGQPQPQTSREMTLKNEMINIMMAQSQGQKINEIQRMSGAQVHISEQIQGNGDQLVTLSGTEESILLAQFLLQSNVDMLVKQERQQQPPMQPRDHPPPPHHQNQQQNNPIPFHHPSNQFDPSHMKSEFEGGSLGGHGPPPHHGGPPPGGFDGPGVYDGPGGPGGYDGPPGPGGPGGHFNQGGPSQGEGYGGNRNFRNNSGERFPHRGRGRRSPQGDRRGGMRRGRR